MFRPLIAIAVAGIISSVYSQQASLSGVVTMSDGSPVESLLVVLERGGIALGECYTDAGGAYTMSVNSGEYEQLRIRNMMRRISGVPYELEYTAKTGVTISSGANSEDITMVPFFTITGTVLTESGDTIKGARIECGQSGGYGPPRDWDSSDETSGAYSLVNSKGSVHITVFPPQGTAAQESSFDIELTSDTVHNLILPVVVNISGVVVNADGDTISGIGVTVEKPSISWQVDSITSADGEYSIPLTPGVVNVRIRNGSQMGGSAAGAPARLEATVIRDLPVQTDTNLTIMLPDYPMVRCSVVTAEGAPVPGVVVKSSSGDMPEVPTGDMDSTNADGCAVLYVEPSVKNNLWIEPPEPSGFITLRDTVITANDTTLVIVLSAGVVLSGTVYYSDSVTGVGGVGIALERGAEQLMVYTDETGAYSAQIEPGTYQLRVRNTGSQPGAAQPEGVPQSLEHTVYQTVELLTTRTINITLPSFPVVTGTVYNSSGQPLDQVSLKFARWNSGTDGPPYCETITGAEGTYRIVVGAGINRVKVQPPTGSLMGAFEFIESFDTSTIKDLYVPDQAKGVTRVQPSVITLGEAGRIVINGINVALDKVKSASQVSLGEGVRVDSIRVISAITLYAFVTIADDAQSGTRDVRISAPGAECIGPSLLTITSPAEAQIELDATGRTTKEIIIGDGTGTELIIPEGTSIALPPGADSIISYKAPLIEENKMDQPPKGEFTQVQRELSPAGLQFNDSVVLKCQYTNQDVEGVDELTLEPYIFDELNSSGDKINVVERDTAANTIAIVVPHFSVVRLASGKTSVRIGQLGTRSNHGTVLRVVQGANTQCRTLLLTIAPDDAAHPVRLMLFDLQGRRVKTYIDGVMGAGTHRVILDAPDWSTTIATGNFVAQLETNSRSLSQKIMVVK